jgi:hypothetical protein
VNTPFAKSIESILDERETYRLLNIVKQIGLAAWLEQNPFHKLEFLSKVFLYEQEVHGVYSYKNQIAIIGTSRDSFDYGHDLNWGKISKLSLTSKTVFQSVQFTFLHELGHHLHAFLYLQQPIEFDMSMRMVRTNAVSQYAKTPNRRVEYFAETFVAWVLYRTELLIFDEFGYGMMQRALRTLLLEVGEYDPDS